MTVSRKDGRLIIIGFALGALAGQVIGLLAYRMFFA